MIFHTSKSHLVILEAGITSEVLDNRHGASLDGQEAGQLEDHVLGAGPAARLLGQLDPYHIGVLELPGNVSHHIHNAGADHTETETFRPPPLGV